MSLRSVPEVVRQRITTRYTLNGRLIDLKEDKMKEYRILHSQEESVRHVEKHTLKKKKKKHNVYCSLECANNKVYAKHVKYINETGMIQPGKNGEADRRVVKRYLTEKYGHKCSICGITEWQGKPAPLIVDHIDGDSTNNKVDNFRLVCGNCDMQLPTYKSKNKKGRAWRKQYHTYIGTAKSASPEVHLKCQWCGKEFTRRAANVPVNGVDKDRFYSCSRSCGAYLSKAVRDGVYTDEQLEQMHKDNILSR